MLEWLGFTKKDKDLLTDDDFFKPYHQQLENIITPWHISDN